MFSHNKQNTLHTSRHHKNDGKTFESDKINRTFNHL